MSKNQIALSPLLERVTSEVIEEVEECETVLESLARMGSQEAEVLKLRLRGQRILLYSQGQEQEGPLASIPLNFTIRFQKLLASAQLPQSPGSFGPSTLKGFKLVHQSGAELSFFIQFAQLAEIWVRWLGRLINQGGFHRRFKPIRKLGRGASATVYEIVSLEDGRRLAAKVFSKEQLQAHPQKFYSFRNEVETLRSLDHGNVVGVEGVYQTEHSYYLVSEVMRGGNLLEFLLRRKSLLSLAEARTLLRGLLVGLAELEQAEVVHRDIKLENLMLRDKDSMDPVIVDFGLAVHSWQEDYGFYKCGTPGYLSPEIINCATGQKLTTKSDIFSAGIVFHVLLMGRYLFDGKDPKSVFEKNKEFAFDFNGPEYAKVDESAIDLLRKMLALNKEDRLSASECLEHPFVRVLEEKLQVSPASTSEDYHF